MRSFETATNYKLHAALEKFKMSDAIMLKDCKTGCSHGFGFVTVDVNEYKTVFLYFVGSLDNRTHRWFSKIAIVHMKNKGFQ